MRSGNYRSPTGKIHKLWKHIGTTGYGEDWLYRCGIENASQDKTTNKPVTCKHCLNHMVMPIK